MTESQAPSTPRRRASDLEPAEQTTAGRSIRVRDINIASVVVAVLLAILAIVIANMVIRASREYSDANNEFITCSNAAAELQLASDYLTNEARLYVYTADRRHLDAYLTELNISQRRDEAVSILQEHLVRQEAIDALDSALQRSNDLSEIEMRALRLEFEAFGSGEMPSGLASVELDPSETAMSPEEKAARAQTMMVDDTYEGYKSKIYADVDTCTNILITRLADQNKASEEKLQRMLVALQIIVILFLAAVILTIVAALYLVLMPLGSYIEFIKNGRPLKSTKGAYELRYLAEAYNTMYEENRHRTLSLQHAAEHDPLTGLFNRGAYDALLDEHGDGSALLLLDVDYFKQFNDEYSHEVGDRVLKKVADTISHSFRLTDYPCRIGGDEFAVIMTDMTPELDGVIASKVQRVTEALLDTSDGLPPVTLSIGIAFKGVHPGEDDIYRAADKALYVVKEHGRNGYAFYGEDKPRT